MPENRQQAQLIAILTVFAITAMLWLGKEFLMPLALSVLVAFLLAPVVSALERWRFGHRAAVVLTALAACTILGTTLYIVSSQAIDLAGALPGYKENLRAKIALIRSAPDGSMQRAIDVVDDLAKDLSTAAPATSREHGQTPAMPVKVMPEMPRLYSVLIGVSGPVLRPFGTAALVMVFVIFMLLERQDLRDRFIHLIGRGRLLVTTEAIDDAASRVSRYLGAQLLVNLCYGVPIGLGLSLIGIPNAPLWGLLAVVLRFLPYVGAWIAAAFPIVLSIVVTPGWWPLAETIALFVIVELITNNVIEPWLYGASTGLSPLAVIVSAAFWTWLWGFGGLLLATPLTVCVAVLGKYVPSFAFLDVLLGDRPPIAPEQRFYQRLLTGDETELFEIVGTAAEEGHLDELFDDVIVPALRQIEDDFASGALDREERDELFRQMREALRSIPEFAGDAEQAADALVIIPTRTEGDEIAADLLAHLVRRRGRGAAVVSHKMLASELAPRLRENGHGCMCLSALSEPAARAAVGLIRRLALDRTHVLVGYWRAKSATQKVIPSDVAVATSLREASSDLLNRAP